MLKVDYEELCLTPAPFYTQAAFLRLKCRGGCDGCIFSPEEDDWEEDMTAGRVCPDNLWWVVMQRQKSMQKFDHSHPPICPNCGERMVADRTITLMDKDVAAFSCNHCHKFERDSRFVIEQEWNSKRNHALEIQSSKDQKENK